MSEISLSPHRGGTADMDWLIASNARATQNSLPPDMKSIIASERANPYLSPAKLKEQRDEKAVAA